MIDVNCITVMLRLSYLLHHWDEIESSSSNIRGVSISDGICIAIHDQGCFNLSLKYASKFIKLYPKKDVNTTYPVQRRFEYMNTKNKYAIHHRKVYAEYLLKSYLSDVNILTKGLYKLCLPSFLRKKRIDKFWLFKLVK